MERSVVILGSLVMTMQLKRLAMTSGIYKTEKYINANDNINWIAQGLNWINNGDFPE